MVTHLASLAMSSTLSSAVSVGMEWLLYGGAFSMSVSDRIIILGTGTKRVTIHTIMTDTAI